jgi:hypothetical protein
MIRIGDGGGRGAEGTLLILGVARSGTSMAASVLLEAGVYLGDEVDHARYEDQEIVRLIEAGRVAELASLVAERNARHELWAFKWPKAHAKLSMIFPLLRRPRIVVMMRDPVAIAVRNNISMYADPASALQTAVSAIANVVAEVGGLDCPKLMVSYEKAMALPRQFCEELLDFCGIAGSGELIGRMTARMENGPELYLSGTRLAYDGEITIHASGVIEGWFMSKDRIPTIDLMDRGRLVCELPLGEKISRPQSASYSFPDAVGYRYRRISHVVAPAEVAPYLHAQVRGTVFRLRTIFAAAVAGVGPERLP